MKKNMIKQALSRKFDTGELHRDSDLQDFLKSINETVRTMNISEIRKSDDSAAKLRIAGNQLYRERKYDEALVCYNESICYAEPNSGQLGMGYANRSAVYYEQGEFEFALYNIDLAKRNNYPEKLMPKLLARELNCKQQIVLGQSKGTVPRPMMSINVDTHPRIPFLADGIGMNYYPRCGRGLAAEKDFNPGDVILDEKIELCGIDFDLSCHNCNHCSARFNYSLIPCPTCPIFMYCSQECLEQNWKFYHRFECGVATKLSSASFVTLMVTPRLFFYGLSQFGDDLQAMMEYCEPEVTEPSNPLDLDYTNLNRLEVYKALYTNHPFSDPEIEYVMKYVACVYYVVFLENPAVSSIIRTAAQQRFFLLSLLQHARLSCSLLADTSDSQSRSLGTISPVYSICNHSCDPNAATFIDSGRSKVIILRPVHKGEQIVTSYGPTWWHPRPGHILGFRCSCIACNADQKWRSMIERRFSPKVNKNLQTLHDVMARNDFSVANKLNALQQFVKRYADRYHPQKDLGMILSSYRLLLDFAVRNENVALERARLQAAYADH
uniref:SET and MYND domain-containing protein 4 n=1 Tax=Culex pipiens TaxID=7175 RepID=A0A8D8N503_CULPI